MSAVILTHKIALDVSQAQRSHFTRAAGTARFAYNWALNRWMEKRASGQTTSEGDLRRELNAIKREQFPWMFDVASAVTQEAIINLGVAFRGFFGKRAQFPRFKTKGSPRSFCIANSQKAFEIDGRLIRLPRVGWVKMREAVRFSGVVKGVSIKEDGGRWFAVLTVHTNHVPQADHSAAIVGVDLGVKSLATLSTGQTLPGPKPLRATLAKIRRAQKAAARKQRGSANSRRAVARLAKIHSRVRNIRHDALHKLTSYLTKTYAVIGAEELHVSGMVRNRKLARAVLDMGFSEFRRQLSYKAALYGARVVFADRWFPSSKICSCCGCVKAQLALSERQFRCNECGFEADRDHNAAMNLERMAAGSAVTACGERRSDAVRTPRVKRRSVKQEGGSSRAEQSNAERESAMRDRVQS